MSRISGIRKTGWVVAVSLLAPFAGESGRIQTIPDVAHLGRHPTLYGKFPSGSQRPSLEQIMRGGVDLPICHCLLLDRRDRRAYVCERDQAMILFALMEPDEGDAHNVFVDGMLMSPGSEDYKVAPPPGLLDEFRRFMDSRVQASDRA